jgi:AraC-type DNA-binding domain-containing proteins
MKSSDELLMEKVIAIINENLENPELSVEFLSEKIGLSRVHLYRKLKDMTGISGSEFVRNIRMKQAATLLRERKISISQVAYTVGFTNSTHFSSVFKKYYGLSPTEYIEQGK